MRAVASSSFAGPSYRPTAGAVASLAAKKSDLVQGPESLESILLGASDIHEAVRLSTGHLCSKPAPSVVYRRVAHAAHDQRGNALWDLEQWDVVQAYDAARPAEVPASAEKHSGYVQDGEQHVLYVRRAPATEHAGCTSCARLRHESVR